MARMELLMILVRGYETKNGHPSEPTLRGLCVRKPMVSDVFFEALLQVLHCRP